MVGLWITQVLFLENLNSSLMSPARRESLDRIGLLGRVRGVAHSQSLTRPSPEVHRDVTSIRGLLLALLLHESSRGCEHGFRVLVLRIFTLGRTL